MDRKLSMQKAMALVDIKSRNTMKRLIREGIVEAERIPTSSGRGGWRISENSLLAVFESKIQAQALDHLRRHRA